MLNNVLQSSSVSWDDSTNAISSQTSFSYGKQRIGQLKLNKLTKTSNTTYVGLLSLEPKIV